MRGRNNNHCNVFCSSSLLLSCKKEKISLLILKEDKNSEQNPEMLKWTFQFKSLELHQIFNCFSFVLLRVLMWTSLLFYRRKMTYFNTIISDLPKQDKIARLWFSVIQVRSYYHRHSSIRNSTTVKYVCFNLYLPWGYESLLLERNLPEIELFYNEGVLRLKTESVNKLNSVQHFS